MWGAAAGLRGPPASARTARPPRDDRGRDVSPCVLTPCSASVLVTSQLRLVPANWAWSLSLHAAGSVSHSRPLPPCILSPVFRQSEGWGPGCGWGGDRGENSMRLVFTGQAWKPAGRRRILQPCLLARDRVGQPCAQGQKATSVGLQPLLLLGRGSSSQYVRLWGRVPPPDPATCRCCVSPEKLSLTARVC